MDIIKKLKEELEKPLPGAESHYKMSIEGRRAGFFDQEHSRGSVLILLFPEKGSLSLVLIKRAEYSGPHSNQVSFPGGKSDEGDTGPVQTALREASEETGVNTEKINILGKLTPLYIPVSNFTVTPIVGYTGNIPKFIPDPREVKYIITVPLSRLLRENTVCISRIELPGLDIEAPGYSIDGEHIWGATAMIMTEFLDIIRQTGFSPQ